MSQPVPEALQFDALHQRGIELLQRLAGRSWTDHNAHDPGITILEQLCYAITDLAYRIQHPMQDLLTGDGEGPYESLPTAAQMLPTAPVTIIDLRKLILDVRGVKNAWVEVVDERSAMFNAATGEIMYRPPSADGKRALADRGPNVSDLRVQGLYRVLIERADASSSGDAALRRAVARRLHRCRGLGQDYAQIEVLGQQPVGVEATLEIGETAEPTALMAQVCRRIAQHMSPSVPRRTVNDLLASGQRVDEVFDGPLLENGCIDTGDLLKLERHSALRISDLLRELMAVPGVVAVKHLRFSPSSRNADGLSSGQWVFEIPTDKTPRFSAEASKIRLERRGLRVAAFGGAKSLPSPLESAVDAEAVAQATAHSDPLSLVPGRDRHVAAYLPVQQQFPTVYGIGSAGLARSVPPQRKAQARQLQAYLMFFDQLLANHFAQLANVGKLFSMHDTTTDSYFSAPVPDADAPGLDRIRVSGTATHAQLLQLMTENPHELGQWMLRNDEESSTDRADLHKKQVERIIRAPAEARAADAAGASRRNRFLDHLLARYGHHLHELSVPELGADVRDGKASLVHLAQRKGAFLRELADIGRDRGTAFDCLEPAGENNRSGLERLLHHKLGLAGPGERFHVVEHLLLRPLDGDAAQQAPLMRAAGSRDPYSLQISLVFPGWGRFEKINFRQFVIQTVHEETPAHLTAHILFKNTDEEMRAFESAHLNWLRRLRDQRRSDLGM